MHAKFPRFFTPFSIIYPLNSFKMSDFKHHSDHIVMIRLLINENECFLISFDDQTFVDF